MRETRPAAPVLLILCSDHRMTRSGDVRLIEEAVDRIAARHGIVGEGESVEFDEIRVPGPQCGLSDAEDAEPDVLLAYVDLLLNLHGGKLLILAFHIGIGEESGCGREGHRHRDIDHVRSHAFNAVERLKRRFPQLSVAIMAITVQNGRTIQAEIISEPLGD